MTCNATTLLAAKTTDGSIKNWLNAGDAPSSDILTEAQAFIYQGLRVRQMLKTTTGTLTANTSKSIALPSDYKSPKHLYFPGGASTAKVTLTYKTIEFLRDAFTYDGSGNLITATPQYWATDASNILFESIVPYAYPFDFLYYGSLTALAVSSNETNFLTNEYPRLLRYVCLMIGNEWKKNDREKIYYQKLAVDAINAVNVEGDQALEGIALSVMIGV